MGDATVIMVQSSNALAVLLSIVNIVDLCSRTKTVGSCCCATSDSQEAQKGSDTPKVEINN
eukprot:1541775-Amphidinium_carterae.1